MASYKFIKDYYSQMVSQIKFLYPDMNIEDIKKYVKEKISKNLKFPEVKLVNNYKDTTYISDFGVVLEDIYDNDAILTGNGVLYCQHEDKLANSAKMISFLKKERKVYKKKMFEAKVDKNLVLEKKNDNAQKTIKIINNSYYGVSAESNSQFYNPYIAESTTYTGVQIITTSIMAFEMLLSNNIKYENLSQLITFITRILNEKYEVNITDIIDKPKNLDEVNEYILNNLIDFNITDEEKNLLYNALSNENEEYINRIYYKNNFYEYIKNTKILEKLKTLTNETIINIDNDISEENKIIVEELKKLFKEHVYYLYQVPDRYKRALTMKRKTILVVDTDSNFVYLDNYVNYMKDILGIKECTEDQNYTLANSILVFLSEYVKLFLDKLTVSANLKEGNKEKINMKNEFLYFRLMTTRNKKQYIGILALQEGVKIEPKLIDMKGLSIKKITVPKKTELFFTNMINRKILRTDNINISDILRDYKNFENTIRNDLLNGDINFITPINVKDTSKYKFPYRMMGVRGVLAYNYINSELPIKLPSEVNLVKLKSSTIEELEPLKNTEYYDIIVNNIFNHKDTDYSKFGFDYIALPKNMNKIPDYIIPLIDIDEIINTNITPGILFLESLGLRLMEFKNSEYYSNVISF